MAPRTPSSRPASRPARFRLHPDRQDDHVGFQGFSAVEDKASSPLFQGLQPVLQVQADAALFK